MGGQGIDVWLYEYFHLYRYVSEMATEQAAEYSTQIRLPPHDMKSYSKLLRVCFLVGAITDGLAVVPMLSPNIGTMLFGGEFARLGVEYRYAMGIGAALMAGWTVLLLWGSVKPIERRDLLVITIFPVVTGIVASTVYGIAQRCHRNEADNTASCTSRIRERSVSLCLRQIKAGDKQTVRRGLAIVAGRSFQRDATAAASLLSSGRAGRSTS